MRKLFVFGCSFSDRYGGVSKAYGDYLAERIGIEYIHCARKCGSNYAIWRDAVSKIRNKEITSEDLVLIQYTEYTRKEFVCSEYPDAPSDVSELFDNDAHLVRFKLHSFKWNQNKYIKKFLKLYETYFVNVDYDICNHRNQHAMFQTFLLYNNINAYFLNLNDYAIPYSINTHIPEFKNKDYEDRLIGKTLPFSYSSTDVWHLSEHGHQQLSNDLYNFLVSKNEI